MKDTDLALVKRFLPVIALLAFLLLYGCYPGRSLPHIRGFFQERTSLGRIDKRLHEASGLAPSLKNPGLLWSINDGGNDAEIYLINQHAEIERIWILKGVANTDWEEVQTGIDPETRLPYIYIGEIGDNFNERPIKIIYAFEEPELANSPDTISLIKKINITLPDGAHDMEAFLVDPITRNFFLFSKREDSIGVYRVPCVSSCDTLSAQKITTLPFSHIVGAGISPSGKELLLKDYRNVYYWRRPSGKSVDEVLRTNFVSLPYRTEMQGEAICFAANESGYFTLSESPIGRSRLFFYRRI